MSNDGDKEHVFAAADSLAGQLQRGRGMGFLRASYERTTVIEPLLIDCVTHDSRWDRQLESRSVYYATLLLQLDIPLDPLAASLRVYAENPAEEAGDAEYFVLDTLCALAVRGDMSAIAIVRAYLTYGRHWEYAFETLMAEVPGLSLLVDEMSQLLDRRFPADADLEDELPGVGPALHTRQEPWLSLRQLNPRVERILSAREQVALQRQNEQELVNARLASLSLSELLALDATESTITYRVPYAFQQHVTDADLDLLLSSAQNGQRWQRSVAFRGLQRLADPAVLPILRAFFESSDTRPGSLYGAAVKAMIALPASATLALAREWFDAPDGLHRHVALLVLEAHATADDVDRVRAALPPSLERDSWGTGECYMQGSMLKILARFPDASFYPLAETVFNEAKYARTRVHAARLLAASDRERFAHDSALECLWDCEEKVRVVGCSNVALDRPEASSRLQILASDPYEDEEVRQTAINRLSSGSPYRQSTNWDKLEDK